MKNYVFTRFCSYFSSISIALVIAGCTHSTDAAKVEFIQGAGALPTGLPFSEAVRVDDTLYLSGQIGVAPGTMDMVPGGMTGQAHQVMRNIGTVLKSQELDYRHLVKCTVMLADMADWPAFNDVYVSYFQPPFPARSAFGASGLAAGAKLEVECIAAFPTE